jgi:transcriptional regulator with XRE-family HTH domain
MGAFHSLGVTYPVTVVNTFVAGADTPCFCQPGTVTGMVTRIHKHAKPRLYLREHREAKGIDAPRMAERMGMERESLYRLEREWHRCAPTKQLQYADALGIDVTDLWFPPGEKPVPVLDSIVEAEPEATKALARDILTQLVGRKAS